MSAGLGNQVAIVTGGSQGLGVAIATRLLRDGIAVSRAIDCEHMASDLLGGQRGQIEDGRRHVDGFGKASGRHQAE